MKHGQVDFAISEDSDLLAFGCQKVRGVLFPRQDEVYTQDSL
jgi:5'-3' exonuclease